MTQCVHDIIGKLQLTSLSSENTAAFFPQYKSKQDAFMHLYQETLPGNLLAQFGG